MKPRSELTRHIRMLGMEKLRRWHRWATMSQALAAYDHLVTFEPADDRGWTPRGELLYGLERLEEAAASYAQALKLAPAA